MQLLIICFSLVLAGESKTKWSQRFGCRISIPAFWHSHQPTRRWHSPTKPGSSTWRAPTCGTTLCCTKTGPVSPKKTTGYYFVFSSKFNPMKLRYSGHQKFFNKDSSTKHPSGLRGSFCRGCPSRSTLSLPWKMLCLMHQKGLRR